MTDLYDMSPDATLIVGPAGGGKTETALDAILDTRLFNPFSTIWVLLANEAQIHAFQDRLLARSPDTVQFGVEFFNFETLYMRLLDLLGDPQRQVEDTARFQILRCVAADLRDRGELEHFGAIAHMPGLIGLLAGLIHELKQGLVLPDSFTQVAQDLGPKDRDLARIYAAYQNFLQHKNLVDRHGAGWLAVAHLERGERLPGRVDLLVVDGFDQFNRVHIRLLNALARQVSRTVLTLTGAPNEPGRRFRRFEQTRARVMQTAPDLWRIENLDHLATRPPALDYLVSAIFLSETERIPGDETIRLIEAPDIGREVGAVLRRVKRLLLDGAPPESITVITRDIRRYSTAVRETARAYGLPLTVREGIPLRENPAVALLLDLVDLHALNFPRRELLDTLHSPYLLPPDLSRDQIAQLERISMNAQVVRGRAAWLAALHDAHTRRQDEDGEPLEAADQTSTDNLRAALIRHFDRITRPEHGTVYDFTRWLEDLIGPDPAADALDTAEAADPIPVGQAAPLQDAHFGILACIRAASDSARATRDIIALQAFKRVLRGQRAATDLLAGSGSPAVMAWSEFRAELALAVERITVSPPGGLSRLGRVLATDVLEARGLPHDHVFILGLSEGVFPAQEPESALYQEGERITLERAGIDMLTAVERADDMSLFYQALGLARRSLTLSRFTIDDKGTPCPPSPYWHAVNAAVDVPQIARIKTGAAPTLADAATLGEAAVAVAAAFSDESDLTAAAGVYNALLEHRHWRGRWRNVLRGRLIEARREDPAFPFDSHSGILTDPRLIEIVARRLGPDRIWSASQFNDFGLCPFRFFARRVLKLEELKEPEEGLDQLQLGSLNHAILEQTYRQIAAEGLSITPENQDRAVDILNTAADTIFARAPESYGFRASPVWTAEQDDIRRRLRWLVELDFSESHPFRLQGSQKPDKHPVAAVVGGYEREPFQLETAFGPGSDLPALVIDGPAGPLHTRGVIDRLDRAGDFVIVVDYKTGTTKHTVSDMDEGRDFQMMLYVLAARDIIARIDPALTVVGGAFWHIRSRAVSGEMRADDPALESARAHLHANILDARAGRFPIQPSNTRSDRCATYCEFRALCRLTRANQRKNLTAETQSTQS